MSDLAILRPGQMVWTRGSNEFGDGRHGGMVVRSDDNPETGERFVLILTSDPMKPRQASVLLHKSKGGYENLGLVARLERMAVGDIDSTATDGFRHAAQVWRHAIDALRAASVPPNNHIGTRAHDELLTAYRTLRAEAELLQRGAA